MKTGTKVKIVRESEYRQSTNLKRTWLAYCFMIYDVETGADLTPQPFPRFKKEAIESIKRNGYVLTDYIK